MSYQCPCEPIFDRKQGVGTCTACGKNFECGAVEHTMPSKCTLIDGIINCRCGDPSLHYGTMGVLGAREVRCVSNPRPRSDVQERFMAKQEVYHSSTLGPIPLSFTGRRLLQNLREAFQELLQRRSEQAARGQVGSQKDWEDVSRARGKIAEYMSKLERGEAYPQQDQVVLMFGKPLDYWFKLEEKAKQLEHTNEVLCKANDAFKLEEQRRRESRLRPRPTYAWKKRYQVRDVQSDVKPGFVCVLYALSMDEALTEAMKLAGECISVPKNRTEFEVRLLED